MEVAASSIPPRICPSATSLRCCPLCHGAREALSHGVTTWHRAEACGAWHGRAACAVARLRLLIVAMLSPLLTTLLLALVGCGFAWGLSATTAAGGETGQGPYDVVGRALSSSLDEMSPITPTLTAEYSAAFAWGEEWRVMLDFHQVVTATAENLPSFLHAPSAGATPADTSTPTSHYVVPDEVPSAVPSRRLADAQDPQTTNVAYVRVVSYDPSTGVARLAVGIASPGDVVLHLSNLTQVKMGQMPIPLMDSQWRRVPTATIWGNAAGATGMMSQLQPAVSGMAMTSAGMAAGGLAAGAVGAASAGSVMGTLSMLYVVQRLGALANLTPPTLDWRVRDATMALSGVFDMGKWHTPFDDQVFRQAIERGLDPGLTAQAMPGNSDPQMRATHGAMTDGDWGDLIDSSMLVQTVRRVFWSAIVLAAVALARPALRASWVALMRRRASAPPGKTHRARAAAHVPAFLEFPTPEVFTALALLPCVAGAAGYLTQGARGEVAAAAVLELALLVLLLLAGVWTVRGQLLLFPAERHLAFVVEQRDLCRWLRRQEERSASRLSWLTAWLGVGRVRPPGEWRPQTDRGRAALEHMGALFDGIAGPLAVRLGASYDVIGFCPVPDDSTHADPKPSTDALSDRTAPTAPVLGHARPPSDPEAPPPRTRRQVFIPRLNRGVLVPVAAVVGTKLPALSRARWLVSQYLSVAVPTTRTLLLAAIMSLTAALPMGAGTRTKLAVTGAAASLQALSFLTVVVLAPFASPAQQAVEALTSLGETLSYTVMFGGYLTTWHAERMGGTAHAMQAMSTGQTLGFVFSAALLFALLANGVGQIYSLVSSYRTARELIARALERTKLADRLWAAAKGESRRKARCQGDTTLLAKKYANRWLGRALRRELPGWPGMYELDGEQESALRLWHLTRAVQEAGLGAEGTLLQRLRMGRNADDGAAEGTAVGKGSFLQRVVQRGTSRRVADSGSEGVPDASRPRRGPSKGNGIPSRVRSQVLLMANSTRVMRGDE